MILGGRGFQAARRVWSSWSESSTFRVRLGMSMVMVSPFWMTAMGPPSKASGVTWPMLPPRVAPLKRPSVMSATDSERPMPAMVAVGMSISGMPGPPLGPSYRIITTSPGTTWLARIAVMASFSDS